MLEKGARNKNSKNSRVLRNAVTMKLLTNVNFVILQKKSFLDEKYCETSILLRFLAQSYRF